MTMYLSHCRWLSLSVREFDSDKERQSSIVTMYDDVCAMYYDVFSTLRCMKMYDVFDELSCDD